MIQMHKQRIISIGMMFCFAVAYLPVTNSWYLSLNGRANLTRLVISAVSIKMQQDKKILRKELPRSFDNMFRELKIAVGLEKVQKSPEKKVISLTVIFPECPVLKIQSMPNTYHDSSNLIPYINVFYQTEQFPPEPPPPECVFFCVS